MSDQIASRDDELWFNIARDAYSGVAAYAIVLVLAFLRDLARKTTFRQRRKFLLGAWSPSRIYSVFLLKYRDTHVFYYVEFLRLAANVAVCTLYVLGTYHRNVFPYMRNVNRTFAGIFLLDILSQVAAAESAIASVLSLYVFFDVFSFPSLILASGTTGFLNFSFLRSIAAYGALSRLERRMFVKIFSNARLIVRLAFQCFALFYTLAAGIQLLEIPGDLLTVDFRQRWFDFDDWNFFNSAYFVIVTLSTVGYGDFSPATVQGRLYTLVMIIVGIVIFTSVIGELVEQSSKGRGSGWFVKQHDSRHVIVTGTPKLSDLVLFVSEFYSDSRQSNADAKVVVLVEEPSWTDSEWFQHIARNQFLQSRLFFLVGSVRNPGDLQRAKITTADAVFFLTSPSTGEQPAQQDSRTVMNILAVRNMRTDIPIYAQTLLEDSKLQTTVALRTPSSWAKGTFFRTSEMKRGASYKGLFYDILRTELEDIPRAHKKRGRACFQDVLRYHNQVHQARRLHSEESGIIPDLQRSRLVCLQETHVALIAANIRVNGVGTLLSNMYLDVQGAKLSEDDPPWLSEYNMGAACSLSYVIIPESLDGVKVCEIALDLYHMGLVLVATTDAEDVDFHPVLHTEMSLRRGDIGMFLTYHERRYTCAALFLVSLRFEKGELRHSLSAGSLDGVSRDMPSLDKSALEGAELQARGTASNDAVSASALREVISSRAGVKELVASSPDLVAPIRARTANSYDMLGGDLLQSHDDCLNLLCSDGYMPDNLSGHVIVAMEGDAPLGNLALFLKNLWRKDKRKSMRKARKQVVVVIHPSVSEQYRSLFAAHEKKTLFFVEGSPSSSDTWRRAKLRKAKSVATMADYTQPWHVTDARTVFTLLTLDVHTATDHDVFICSELVDEKSLEFLREPTHSRRRGAMLGEPMVQGTSSIPVISADAVPPGSRVVVSGDSPTNQTGDDLPSGVSSSPPGGKSVGFQRDDQDVVVGCANPVQQERAEHVDGTLPVFETGVSHAMAGNPISAHLLSGKKGGAASTVLHGLEDALQMPLRSGADASVKSGQLKGSTLKDLSMRENSRIAAEGIDPADKPGAARARRGSLFSRSRYASGELLVHSSAIALLAREYIEPGFSKFLASILGAESSSPGLKIRLLRIPRAMFSGEHAVTRREGQRFVPYVHVFRTLLSHGVTTLGVYRSGDAPALLPVRSRRRRGGAIAREIGSYMEKMSDTFEATSSSSGGMFTSFLRHIAEVAPSKVREEHDRNEVHGRTGGVGSSDTSESSDAGDFAETLEGDFGGESDRKAGHDQSSDVVSAEQVQEAVPPEGGAPRHHASLFNRPRTGVLSPRRKEFLGRFLFNADDSFEVPGQAKYKERVVTQNLLPYVFTLPDPNTLCAETDGIFVLCHPCFDLSAKWEETKHDGT